MIDYTFNGTNILLLQYTFLDHFPSIYPDNDKAFNFGLQSKIPDISGVLQAVCPNICLSQNMFFQKFFLFQNMFDPKYAHPIMCVSKIYLKPNEV